MRPPLFVDEDDLTGTGNMAFDYLHGEILALKEDISSLIDQQYLLEENMNRFINQSRLLMGAMLQNRSPETILQLLINGNNNEHINSFSSVSSGENLTSDTSEPQESSSELNEA